MDLWGEIGNAAGKIFMAFGGAVNKPLTSIDLKRKTGLDDMMLCMALGWLAREDKVSLDKKGEKVFVQLK
jgi:hypothetical protein